MKHFLFVSIHATVIIVTSTLATTAWEFSQDLENSSMTLRSWEGKKRYLGIFM